MNDQTFQLPPVYPLTDMRLSGLSHAEQVRRLCDGGATLIQLREKHAPAGEFFAAAEAALQAARSYRAKIIINDRVDVARAIGADGVHLGQDDLPPAAARRVLGAHAIIGYSTHNLTQAVAAAALPVNYVAMGPVFATTTKANPDPVVGIAGITAARAHLPATLPLVAIGGIRRANSRAVFAAGADSMALVSELLANPARITNTMRDLLERCG